MQVEIIKDSGIYKKGVADVTPGRASYLIRVGVAVEVKKPVKSKKGK